jgi:hypothetical protein
MIYYILSLELTQALEIIYFKLSIFCVISYIEQRLLKKRAPNKFGAPYLFCGEYPLFQESSDLSFDHVPLS